MAQHINCLTTPTINAPMYRRDDGQYQSVVYQKTGKKTPAGTDEMEVVENIIAPTRGACVSRRAATIQRITQGE